MKKIYLPGEELPISKTRTNTDAILIKGKKVYATVVGVVENNNFIPFELVYRPKVNDSIIGVVISKKNMGYFIETNSGYTAIALARELNTELKVGDIVFGRISRIENNDTIILSQVSKLSKGYLLKVPPSKVPRIIGKNASMINAIKKNTNSFIYIGSNGYIFIGIKGDVKKAIKSIKLIVKKSHLEGLTNEIENMGDYNA